MTKTNKNAAEEFKQTIIDRSTYILEEESEQFREELHMIEMIVWRLKENDKPYEVQLLARALDDIFFTLDGLRDDIEGRMSLIKKMERPDFMEIIR